MAKKLNNLDSLQIAEAALNESSSEGAKEQELKVTQKIGSVQICLKKFPQIWHEKIKAYTPSSVSDYIILAVREKMARDGILK